MSTATLAAPVLAALLLLAPPLARLLAVRRTRPLEPGHFRARLEDLARRAQVPLGDIRVQEGGGTPARLLGLAGRKRLVVLSGEAFGRLPPGEVECLFAHEIGHARRRHPVLVLALLASLVLGAGPLLSWAAGIEPLLGPPAALVLILALGGALLSGLARWLELEADAEAARLVGPELYRASLGRAPGAGRKEGDLLHPPFDLRESAVEGLSADGRPREAFLRRGIWLRLGVVGLLALSVLSWAASAAMRG